MLLHGLAHIGKRIKGAATRQAADARQLVEPCHKIVMAGLERGIHALHFVFRAIERRHSCLLADARGVGGRLALHRGHGGDDLARPAAIAYAPAGHGIALGATVNGDGALVQAGYRSQQAAERLFAPINLFVDVVGGDQQLRMV